MILPMKKVCIVVHEKHRDESIKKLRGIGVMHLERRNAPVDINSSALKNKAKVEDAVGLIQDYKPPKKKKLPVDPNDKRPAWERRAKPIGMHRGRRATDVFGTDDEAPYSIDAVRAPVRPFLPDLMLGFGEKRKALKENESDLKREISRLEGWGDFDPSIINDISARMPVFLYEMTHEDFAKIAPDPNINFIKLKSDKTVIRIVVFENKLPDTAVFQIPEKSLSILKNELSEVKVSLQEVEEKIKSFADRRPALAKDMAKVLYELEFETAIAGMQKVTDTPENTALCWLTGYVPDEDMSALKRTVAENNWALSAVEPDETDEKVPTKVKNNKVVNLLTPITSFLEIRPGYHEYDISPFFLFFFCIFFGMIYGDAGYGLILTLTGLIGIIVITAKKQKPPVALVMLLLLGVCNTIWGTLICSWFGAPLEKLPQFLRDISLSYISEAKSTKDTVNQNLQILCFSLGLIHLSVAHVINMFRCKSPRILGELGSIAMLAGMYNVVLMLIVSNEIRAIPLLPITIPVIAGGWVLNFLFGSYVKGMGQAIKSSLSNIMSVILGVVSIFSDIMSYIRLWAVGLAGAAIAGTVNQLAGPMLGSFLIFMGIILLIFGHGMIMVLNVLSVLVDGVRLNTLEFSGHVGLTWSGVAYMPFKEKIIK